MSILTRSRSDADLLPGGVPSVPALLLARAEHRPSGVALRQKELGRWREVTWAEYATRCARVAMGLADLEVGAGERVAVLSGNRVEWLCADLAIQGLGATTVGIDPDSPPARVEELLRSTGTVVLFAEDEEQLDKVMAVRSELPHLRTIVLVDARGAHRLADDALVVTLARLEQMGERDAIGARRSMDEYRARVERVGGDDPAVIVEAPETPEAPGAPNESRNGGIAALSHRELLVAAGELVAGFDLRSDDEVLSFLPLSHPAERVLSMVGPLASGHTVNFGGDGESAPLDRCEVQPTVFAGVAAVWDRMQAGVEARMSDARGLPRWIYRSWLGPRPRRPAGPGSVTLPTRGLGWRLGWFLLYRPLRRKLGLLRVRVALSYAGQLDAKVVAFYRALGVDIHEWDATRAWTSREGTRG